MILDSSGWFYPPAAAAWGIDLRRLIWLRPHDEAGALWAFDQALRCRAVAAAWAWLPRLESRWFRRFQLAAESSGSLGLLLRPAHVRGQPSWAEIQLGVQPQPDSSRWRWRVELLRCREQGHLGHVELRWSHRVASHSLSRSPFPMKRILCLWFPEWPLQRLLVTHPELKQQAIVLYARAPRGGEYVVACCRRAQERGIRPGMSRTEAAR